MANVSTTEKPALAVTSSKENLSGVNAASTHVLKIRRLSIADCAMIFRVTISCPSMILTKEHREYSIELDN